MHVSGEFRAHFILDLLNRAKKFLSLIAKESEDLVVELQQFRSREKEDKVDIAVLDPCNLIFFSKLIFENDYVKGSEKAKLAKTMFDVTLSMALVFRKREDYHVCHDLLK